MDWEATVMTYIVVDVAWISGGTDNRSGQVKGIRTGNCWEERRGRSSEGCYKGFCLRQCSGKQSYLL